MWYHSSATASKALSAESFLRFLHLDYHWADWAETKRSGELTAAVGAKIAEHAAAKGVDKLSPDYLKLFYANRKAS